MTYKQFKGWLIHWTRKAVDVRDESQRLAQAAVEIFSQHRNANGFTDMLLTLNTIKGFNTKAFMDWVFFVTGGDTGETAKGLPIIDPEKSCLTWDMEKKVFHMNDNAMPDAETMRALANFKWYDFAPKSIPNPYEIKSLISAIKKADKSRSILSADDTALVDAIMRVAADKGYAEALEQ